MFVTDIRKEFYDVVINQVRVVFLSSKDDKCLDVLLTACSVILPTLNVFLSCVLGFCYCAFEDNAVSLPQRVALLVATDIDALCACKVLQVK